MAILIDDFHLVRSKNINPNPLLHIIVAHFNHSDSVETTIRSILSSDFGSLTWALTLVDDGSDEAEWSVISKLADYYDCNLIRSKRNYGPSAARNSGVALLDSHYISIVDADDIVSPNRFLNSVNFLSENSQFDVVGGQLVPFGRWGLGKKSNYPLVPLAISRKFAKGVMGMAGSSTTFRREWFVENNGYDLSLRIGEDFDLYLRGDKKSNYANLPGVNLFYRRINRQADYSHFKSSSISAFNILLKHSNRREGLLETKLKQIRIFWTIKALRVKYILTFLRGNAI